MNKTWILGRYVDLDMQIDEYGNKILIINNKVVIYNKKSHSLKFNAKNYIEAIKTAKKLIIEKNFHNVSFNGIDEFEIFLTDKVYIS